MPDYQRRSYHQAMSILDRKEVARARSGPHELKDPRSKAYAIQTLFALKRYAESLRCDQERMEKELEEIARYRHWEVLGYPSQEAMLLAELNETGRENVTKVQAAAAKTTGDVLPEGRPKKTSQIATLSQAAKAKANGVSKRTQEKLDRLAREFPKLHAQVKSGELSCHAASVQAGIVKVKTPLDQLKHWWGKASEKERAAFGVEYERWKGSK